MEGVRPTVRAEFTAATSASYVRFIDEMAYTRGSRDDYDHWASIADDDNLSWNKILPYILKVRKSTASYTTN